MVLRLRAVVVPLLGAVLVVPGIAKSNSERERVGGDWAFGENESSKRGTLFKAGSHDTLLFSPNRRHRTRETRGSIESAFERNANRYRTLDAGERVPERGLGVEKRTDASLERVRGERERERKETFKKKKKKKKN